MRIKGVKKLFKELNRFLSKVAFVSSIPLSIRMEEALKFITLENEEFTNLLERTTCLNCGHNKSASQDMTRVYCSVDKIQMCRNRSSNPEHKMFWQGRI